ncbi:MAG TPA: hypothetical protein VFQ61_04255 [Polyangiaceae bacterium]|nr:hypothetical protein [Polyangiaceae bacterium]
MTETQKRLVELEPESLTAELIEAARHQQLSATERQELWSNIVANLPGPPAPPGGRASPHTEPSARPEPGPELPSPPASNLPAGAGLSIGKGLTWIVGATALGIAGYATVRSAPRVIVSSPVAITAPSVNRGDSGAASSASNGAGSNVSTNGTAAQQDARGHAPAAENESALDHPVPSASAGREQLVHAKKGTGVAELQADSVNSVPTSARSSRAGEMPASPKSARPAVSVEEPKAAATEASSLREESQLLLEARSSLRTGNASQALAILGRGRARFPRGPLMQEREALYVEALARSGQKQAAAQSAELFLRNYPKSPHAADVRRYLSP